MPRSTRCAQAPANLTRKPASRSAPLIPSPSCSAWTIERAHFSLNTGTAMQNYGLSHVWTQGDFVTRGILLALVIMSVMSWTVIVVKTLNVLRLKRLTKNAERAFWHSDDFAERIQKLGGESSNAQGNPYLALALSGQHAADHHNP